MGLESVESRYLDGRTVMNCADVTAAQVDDEVMKILKDCYKEAKRLLKENRNVMDQLADFLIQKETITGKEFMKIFREIKGLPEPEEKEKKDKPEEVKAESVAEAEGGVPAEEKGSVSDEAETEVPDAEGNAVPDVEETESETQRIIVREVTED